MGPRGCCALGDSGSIGRLLLLGLSSGRSTTEGIRPQPSLAAEAGPPRTPAACGWPQNHRRPHPANNDHQPPATPKPPPTTTEPPASFTQKPPPLTVAASGDILETAAPVYSWTRTGRGRVTQVKPFLETAQLAFVNVGIISDKGVRAHGRSTFRGRPALADGLAYAGIDVISLANNHSVDYGTKALLDTFSRLSKAGVQWAGAGADAAAAAEAAMLITPPGSWPSSRTPKSSPADSRSQGDPGVNATTPDRKKILSAVAASEKADFVIVSFHWGEEYTGVANRDQQLAHQVIDAGADLVLGHHPHVLQGWNSTGTG